MVGYGERLEGEILGEEVRGRGGLIRDRGTEVCRRDA
jgi:hypothetical protein